MMEILDLSQDLVDGLLAKEGAYVPSVPIVLGYSVNEYYKKTAPPIYRGGLLGCKAS